MNDVIFQTGRWRGGQRGGGGGGGEEEELESMRGELQRLSSSRGSQRAVWAKAEAKVVGWEAKVADLPAGGEEDREGWAAANLEKARQRVRKREDNIR